MRLLPRFPGIAIRCRFLLQAERARSVWYSWLRRVYSLPSLCKGPEKVLDDKHRIKNELFIFFFGIFFPTRWCYRCVEIYTGSERTVRQYTRFRLKWWGHAKSPVKLVRSRYYDFFTTNYQWANRLHNSLSFIQFFVMPSISESWAR